MSTVRRMRIPEDREELTHEVVLSLDELIPPGDVSQEVLLTGEAWARLVRAARAEAIKVQKRPACRECGGIECGEVCRYSAAALSPEALSEPSKFSPVPPPKRKRARTRKAFCGSCGEVTPHDGNDECTRCARPEQLVPATEPVTVDLQELIDSTPEVKP